MLYSIITTRPISKQTTAPQKVVTSTEAPSASYSDIDLSGLPMYYYDPIGFLVYLIVYILWFIFLVLLNLGVLIAGIFLIIFLCKNKKVQCPKCNKKIRYMKKKPKYCPKCGAEIDIISDPSQNN